MNNYLRIVFLGIMSALALCMCTHPVEADPKPTPEPELPLSLVQIDSLGWRYADAPYRAPEEAAVTVQTDQPIKLHFYGWSQEEDTVVHLHFPEDMSPYGMIQLTYTMCGWNKGPAAWDMTTQIMVHDRQSDEWYELTRCITPYGGSFTRTWSKSFYIDVTEFASLLAGDAELKVFYCGWDATASRAHAVRLSFALYEEKPRYGKAVWHQKIYDSTIDGGNTGYRSWAYGVQSDTANYSIEAPERLGLRTIQIPEGVTDAILRVCFTGHGQDALTGHQGTYPDRPGYQPNNSAEFDYNYYTIHLDGNTVAQKGYIWEFNQNNYSQAGTYKYDRCGWGPGKPCNVQHWRLSGLNGKARTMTLDFDLDRYISTNTSPRAESVAQFYVEVDIFGYATE